MDNKEFSNMLSIFGQLQFMDKSKPAEILHNKITGLECHYNHIGRLAVNLQSFKYILSYQMLKGDMI